MILNLEKKIWIDYIKKGLRVFPFIKSQLLRRRELVTLSNDSRELKRLFYAKFPRLLSSIENNIVCTSCGLCEKICPTSALKLKTSNLFEIPDSLTQGEIPKALHLDLNACNLCGLCEIVCPVNALDMRGGFESESSVDLVAVFNQQINDHEVEAQS